MRSISQGDGDLLFVGWNDNVVTAQIHNRFIAYILFLHALAGWCQFRVKPPGLPSRVIQIVNLTVLEN
jgi:hypothetical protein